MRTKKISIIIPYSNRINNIKYALKSLNNQKFKKQDYEIIIGCLEYSIELLSFIREEVPELDIILVISNESWNVSRARNIAIKEAVGEILIFVDADIIVPENFLELQYKTHTKSNDSLFVIGQMRDYEGFDVGDMVEYNGGNKINDIILHPFEYYKNKYLSKKSTELDFPDDIRWNMDIYINWSMGWTFNLSVPRKIIFENDIFFDENFKGWGVEDLDWAYRISQVDVKMIFSDEIWGIHLDHERDSDKNHQDVKINFKKMLNKWPEFDVEIITSFGDIIGNQKYKEIMKNINLLTNDDYPDICTIEFVNNNKEKFLYIGGCINNNDKTIYHINLPDELKNYSINKILPLLGVSLPYKNKSILKIFYSPNIYKIDNFLKDMIDEESRNIAEEIIRLENNLLNK